MNVAEKPEAKKLRCRGPVLDKLVEAKRPKHGENDGLQGNAVQLTDIEPWPEPVDGTEVLDAIARRFQHYVVLPEGAADTLTLWCAHTHVFMLFQITPRLSICSPTQECGKTTTRDCSVLVLPTCGAHR